jgi:hypothetical protein
MAEMRVRRLEEAQFETCSDEWSRVVANDNQATVFDTWEWLSTYRRHHKEGEFHVLSISGDKGVVAFAPFVIETSSLMGLQVRKVAFFGGLGDYNSIIVSDGMKPECYASILGYFYNEYSDWDVIDLLDLPEWSEFVPYSRKTSDRRRERERDYYVPTARAQVGRAGRVKKKGIPKPP